MSDSVKGIQQEGNKYFIFRPTKKGQQKLDVSKWLAVDLKSLDASALSTAEIEYEMQNGQVVRIRLKDQEWRTATQSPVAGPVATPIPATPAPTGPATMFYHPYNFVPALPRDTVAGDLADGRPMGHHAYHADYWSGRITVQLETVTPLLLPDAARLTARGQGQDWHKTYPVRVDAQGAPYLAPTSIKGMLRTAYEAVTNSRLGVFEEHQDRLGYRNPAQGGGDVVPARVLPGNQIELLLGSTAIDLNSRPTGNVMYAAWLPTYASTVTYPGSASPNHGDEVWAEIELWEHHIWRVNPAPPRWINNFNFWKVRQIIPTTSPCPVAVSMPSIPNPFPAHNPRHSIPHLGAAIRWIRGYVLNNNKNMNNKHDERVFFNDLAHPVPTQRGPYSIPAGIGKEWENLIKNYQEIHKKEIASGITRPPALSPACQWSRHITMGNQKLVEGTLCYARVQNNAGVITIKKLYPVMISRELYEKSPTELLPASLHPAADRNFLSPAERVFGWVGEKQAYKGQLRVGPAKCNQGSQAIESLGNDGFPLAILGQPKPEQALFYCARDKQGNPLPIGTQKRGGYQNPNQGLRGRKFYPHHAHLVNNAYWSGVAANTGGPFVVSGQSYYYESRRPNDSRDNQNRSIKGWIKPNQSFTFDIQVTNLSRVELGALLWLLNLGDGYCHRLGGGKPLGFGSVKLSIQGLELYNGQGWREFYRSLLNPSVSPANLIDSIQSPIFQQIIADYQNAVVTSYGGANPRFHDVSFIKAFLNSARGFGNLPMHYPRTTQNPNPDGGGYEWFGENDRHSRRPLPMLADDNPNLPYLP